MRVTTTIRPGPRSTDLDRLDKEIESHPIWTELRGPVTYYYAGMGGGIAADIAIPGLQALDAWRAARAAETVGTTLDALELSGRQASNYARYVKKLPSGAQDPVITRGADGAVQFSADVPGRVPGSYATYTKIVDSGGTTTDYFKTTVAPDGSIVHVKIKFP